LRTVYGAGAVFGGVASGMKGEAARQLFWAVPSFLFGDEAMKPWQTLDNGTRETWKNGNGTMKPKKQGNMEECKHGNKGNKGTMKLWQTWNNETRKYGRMIGTNGANGCENGKGGRPQCRLLLWR
jgi:hypothetical protein